MADVVWFRWRVVHGGRRDREQFARERDAGSAGGAGKQAAMADAMEALTRIHLRVHVGWNMPALIASDAADLFLGLVMPGAPGIGIDAEARPTVVVKMLLSMLANDFPNAGCADSRVGAVARHFWTPGLPGAIELCFEFAPVRDPPAASAWPRPSVKMWKTSMTKTGEEQGPSLPGLSFPRS